MRYEIKVPPTADGSLEVTIGSWLVQAGAQVRRGQDLAEATTEKITLYLSAPVDGVLSEILAEKGTRVKVGDVVGAVEGD
jgi:pyruvate/2-oxoglutarate dehydrogenase complex dihydrolipoamide acyltransferase (E2) component